MTTYEIAIEEHL